MVTTHNSMVYVMVLLYVTASSLVVGRKTLKLGWKNVGLAIYILIMALEILNYFKTSHCLTRCLCWFLAIAVIYCLVFYSYQKLNIKKIHDCGSSQIILIIVVLTYLSSTGVDDLLTTSSAFKSDSFRKAEQVVTFLMSGATPIEIREVPLVLQPLATNAHTILPCPLCGIELYIPIQTNSDANNYIYVFARCDLCFHDIWKISVVSSSLPLH